MIKTRSKNLFNKNWEVIHAYFPNFTDWKYAGDSTSYRIAVKPNTSYTIKSSSTNNIFRVGITSSDEIPAHPSPDVVPCDRLVTSSFPNTATITTQSDTKYLIIQIGSTSAATTIEDLMVNEGDNALSYQNYMEEVKKIYIRKFKSALGKQDDLEEVTSETAGKQYINIGNGHFVRRNRTTSSIIPYRFNLSLDPTHTYFGIVLFDKPVSNLNLYNYDATLNKNTAFTKYSLTNGICGTVTGAQKLDSIHLWQGNDNMPTDIMPSYVLYIDLTAYGLEDLTAQQFYDRYSSILQDVAGNKLSTVKKIYTKVNNVMTITYNSSSEED